MWPIHALIAALALLPTPTLALAGEFEAGPDSPEVAYWFRNLQGPGPQAGDMDPGLREIADAFGSGDLEQARSLAEALLADTDDPDLRSEAAAFIVQSHLAEGDFEGARAAAERVNDAESLARINRIEAEYKAEVGRLQRIVATTKDPAEAARAQLLSARAHERAWRFDLAEQSYQKVVTQHPNSAQAPEAMRRLAELHWRQGEGEAALSACERAIDACPQGELGVAACETLIRLLFRSENGGYEVMRERLRSIAVAHAGTPTGDTARLGVGELYAAEGSMEAAREEWTSLVLEQYDSPVAVRAYARLLALAYDMGTKARVNADFPAAVRWLQRFIGLPSLVGPLRGSGVPLGYAEGLGAPKRDAALLQLGDAYVSLAQWGKAAEVFAELALPGCAVEETGLFYLGFCQAEAGWYEEAREALLQFVERFPDSEFMTACQERLRLVERALESASCGERVMREGGGGE